ncbi:hypothetical protein HYG81_02310 [Natrinema zhouii]|uniref:Uncharacterized protein n=1 Tax=Natrinema zhouii TaxID=1710539 RepID=A0A7D6CS30_9EURY|nr:hypothetical protein [Natrinema zhouii]QLK26473.1 hypothetical protein HYG81_02310 [Natrinema zhouii]
MNSQSLGPTLIGVGFAVIVVPFVVMFFLAIGPVGWLLIGGSIIVVGIAVSLREAPSYDDGDHLERTNCADCGARIDADADTCEHCGAVR